MTAVQHIDRIAFNQFWQEERELAAEPDAVDGNRAYEPDPFWTAPPPPIRTRETDVRWPWALRLLLMIGAAVWCLAVLGIKSLFGQVVPVIELRHGAVSSIIRNPSLESQRVTVALWHGVGATLEREVVALVAPNAFTLQPGETQTLRIKLREPVSVGTVLRLLTCFVPSAADAPAPGSVTTAVARLVLRQCLNSKVRVVT